MPDRITMVAPGRDFGIWKNALSLMVHSGNDKGEYFPVPGSRHDLYRIPKVHSGVSMDAYLVLPTMEPAARLYKRHHTNN